MTNQPDDADDRTAFVDTTRLKKPVGLPKAKLICLDKSLLADPSTDLEVDLVNKEQTIGRGTDNTLVLNATGISKHHARVYPEQEAWIIEDVGSTNGIKINEERVQKSLLSAGDTVRIGKVPFQFVLVRPDIRGLIDKDGRVHDDKHPKFDPDMTVSERTMFVSSDLAAASILLDARMRQQQQAAEQVAAPAARPSTRMGAQQTRVPRKRRTALIAGIVAAMLLAGVLVWYFGFSGGAREEELVRAYRKDVQTFQREAADSGYDKPDSEGQATVLSNLAVVIDDSARQFPASAQLKALQMQVLFLRFERDLRKLFDAGQADKAHQLHVDTLARFSELQTAVKAGEDDAAKQMARQVAGLLELASPVIKIKAFRQQFPDPSPGAAKRPDAGTLAKMLQVRQDFARLKKDNNLALSVSFPYFNQIVADVDQNDILLLDKWSALAGGTQ